MQLTGQQIIDRDLVSNYAPINVQQQGLDVRVKSISKVNATDFKAGGYVPANGKTRKPKTTKLEIDELESPMWSLEPGYYEVELMEGCNLPKNICMVFKTRSSLVRCGAEVHSGQFDAGFHTEYMGCFLEVRLPITIEFGACIAQAIFNETADVTNLYDGQWQADKQRK